MPTFDFTCKVCGTAGREWRAEGPPRFCSRECQRKGTFRSTRVIKHRITPEMAARIRAAYQGDTGKGEIRDLAKKLKLPRWKVTRFAASMARAFVRTPSLMKKMKRWGRRSLKKGITA
jgi:hypothetical protein